MLQVEREEFISYLKDNNLTDKAEAIKGTELSVMQYVVNSELMAYAQYANYGKCWGLTSVTVSYHIREN